MTLKVGDGPMKAVELLYSPKAEGAGLPDSPQVLARWPKKSTVSVILTAT
jgi:hypothetical protein